MTLSMDAEDARFEREEPEPFAPPVAYPDVVYAFANDGTFLGETTKSATAAAAVVVEDAAPAVVDEVAPALELDVVGAPAETPADAVAAIQTSTESVPDAAATPTPTPTAPTPTPMSSSASASQSQSQSHAAVSAHTGDAEGQGMSAYSTDEVLCMMYGVDQARSIHWSPYDPVRVVNAVS
jgi:hypothetical protein